ncbi:MAG TPA: carotenoid oxygenase family protein [Solirubrobacteraceae bacterium]|nr:carotenoid oxygenase family protein [Solirubrobacteraceae bacterium]
MQATTTVGTDNRLGFTSQDAEVVVDRLPIEGALPSWLAGSLLRTGPSKFEVAGRSLNHWFDGLAMLHRFSFADGEASYASRFLRSRAYNDAERQGKITMSEFATDPCRSIFKRIATSLTPPTPSDNANVNVARLGDQFLALTETPLPVVFDPQTLATAGVGDPAPGQHATAHPHHDPDSGELIAYATHFGPRSSYQLYARDGGGRERRIAKIPVSRPGYMHSFALTPRYIALVEFPFVVNPLALALSGRPFIENYRWQPERGTRVLVIDRADGSLQGTYEAEPCFIFHHVNAFERERELVLDFCAYEDPEIVRALYLERVRSPSPAIPEPQLRRWRIDLDGGGVQSEALADETLELPRIDYRRRNGRPYNYVYGAGVQAAGSGGFFDQIVKLDVERGDARTWAETGCYPGEPVFVPTPGGTAEDDGVLLSVVLDGSRGGSFLLVLDAGSLEEIARAHVPHHIPFGFHGQYFRD